MFAESRRAELRLGKAFAQAEFDPEEVSSQEAGAYRKKTKGICCAPIIHDSTVTTFYIVHAVIDEHISTHRHH